jgi:hypothetical protein
MDVKRLAMLLKLRKISGTVVHHCAILRKLMKERNIETRLVKGFCVSPGEVCEHYWVETLDEGLHMDIGLELAKMYSPDLGSMNTMLLETLPEELKDVQVLRQEDNERLYDLYQTDPKTFWNETPWDVRTFTPGKAL